MTDHVTVNDHDATRIITMRRPDKKNALSPAMYRAMGKAIDGAQQDPAIRCLIVTGSAGSSLPATISRNSSLSALPIARKP